MRARSLMTCCVIEWCARLAAKLAIPHQSGAFGRRRSIRGDGFTGGRKLCRSRIGFWVVSCVFWVSGGSHVLVDQAAQDRFSADLASVEVPCGDAGRLVFSVGDALADPLMRAGGVVVLLIPGQDGAQVGFAEDRHPVQEFAAQRADEALTGRECLCGKVRAHSPDRGDRPDADLRRTAPAVGSRRVRPALQRTTATPKPRTTPALARSPRRRPLPAAEQAPGYARRPHPRIPSRRVRAQFKAGSRVLEPHRPASATMGMCGFPISANGARDGYGSSP